MSQQSTQNNPYIDDSLMESIEQYSDNQNERFKYKNKKYKKHKFDDNYKNKKMKKGKHKKKRYDEEKDNDSDNDNKNENKTKITKKDGDILRMTKIPKENALEEENIKSIFNEYKDNIIKFQIVEFRTHKYKDYHPCSIYIQFDTHNSRENAIKYIDELKKNNIIKKKNYNLKYSSWKFKEKKPQISIEELKEKERQKEEGKKIKFEKKKLEKERRKMEAEKERKRLKEEKAERIRKEKEKERQRIQREKEKERKRLKEEKDKRIRKEMEQKEMERKIREQKQKEMKLKLENEKNERMRIQKQKEEKLRKKLEEEQKNLKNKIRVKKLPKFKLYKMKKSKNVSNNDEKNEEIKQEEKEIFELEIDGFIDAKERQKQLLFKRAIIFVIDVSGSMSGSRIKEVRNSVIPFVNKMLQSDKEIKIQLITFCDVANLCQYDLNQNIMERLLQAGGGTDFYCACLKLVECANRLYKEYCIQIILLSDGEVSKENADKAHLYWKEFVENKYMSQHDVYPFVESIGIGIEHDADILDGFICNDEYGNYTQTKKSNEISIALNRSSMDAIYRVGYKLKIETEFPFLINLYTQKTSKIYEMFITKMEYLRKFWVFKNDMNLEKENVIKLNNQKVIIEAMIGNNINDENDGNVKEDEYDNDEKELMNEQIICYHYQLLKDMIDHLRQFKDEINLKNEAQKIQSKLYELKYIFGEIILNKNKINMKQYEGNDENIIDKINEMLNSLQLLLKNIIDCNNINIQEIRQNILMLHFGQGNVDKVKAMNTNYI